MRAAFIRRHGGPEVIEIGELPKPKVKSGEVLVRVKYTSLNHLDLWVREGWPSLKLNFPHVLGGDASGTIEEVGNEVSRFKVGDDIIVHPGMSCGGCEHCLLGWETLCRSYHILGESTSGTNAEYVAVPAANIFPKPPALSLEEAAALPLVFTTAWQMLVRRARVKPGDTVLIHGAGSGVTTAAIQIARLYRAIVFVTSRDDAKLAAAKTLGADFTINSAKEDFQSIVRKQTPGGVDIIIDHIGKDFWGKNIKSLRTGGTLVTCGATSGPNGETDLRHVFFRQISILGSTMGTRGDFPTILSHVSRGKFKAVVDRTFSLAQLSEAHRYLAERAQFGKVMISLNGTAE